MAGHSPDIKIPQLPHLKAVVITAAWHPEICDALVAGAVRGFQAAGISSPTTRTVAGSFELPLAAQLAFHTLIMSAKALLKELWMFRSVAQSQLASEY